GVLLFAGLTLLAGIVILLGELIGSYWLSALIVGAVLLVVGAVTAFGGVRRVRSIDPTPRATLETVQESLAWARAEAKEVRATLLGRGGSGPPRGDRVITRPASDSTAILPERASSVSAGGTAAGGSIPEPHALHTPAR